MAVATNYKVMDKISTLILKDLRTCTCARTNVADNSGCQLKIEPMTTTTARATIEQLRVTFAIWEIPDAHVRKWSSLLLHRNMGTFAS